MPSLRQYARLIEDCERRALQPGAETDTPIPLFPLDLQDTEHAMEDGSDEPD